MIRILLSGASGRLCTTIGRLAADRDDIEILGGIDLQPAAGSPYPIWQDYAELPSVPDVIIDCSHHTAVGKLLAYAKANQVPVVICTTGHTEDETAQIHEASAFIPVLHSRNMSLESIFSRNWSEKPLLFWDRNTTLKFWKCIITKSWTLPAVRL